MTSDTDTPESAPSQTSPPAQLQPPESWLTDARKALVTQLLAVIITPATVAITIVLTEKYKSAKPLIEYRWATADAVAAPPPDSVADAINRRPKLATAFRQELLKMPPAATDSTPQCAAWLDGESWDDACLAPLITVTNSLLAQTTVDLAAMRERKKNLPTRFAPTKVEIDEAEADIRGLTNIRTTVIAHRNRQRHALSGAVTIMIGVLNAGDSDCTVHEDARLQWKGKEVQVTGVFEVVEAHHFKEIDFRTSALSDVTIDMPFRPSDEPILRALSEDVQNRRPVHLTLFLNVSGREMPVSLDVAY